LSSDSASRVSSLSFTPDEKNLNALKGSTVLIKAGGNALTDAATKKQIASQIAWLYNAGVKPVIVHGGGIEIQQLLDDVGVQSEFIGGHRKTDARAMGYVEMALSGMVNKELTGLLNHMNVKAVGISGKDGRMVTAVKRYHTEKREGKKITTDLGFVGDVLQIDTTLIHTLSDSGYLPVVSPVSIGEDGQSYNINADMFAGHLAGELRADRFIALTNIDGLMRDIKDPGSMIRRLSRREATQLFGTVIQGGMIPKVEACLIALNKGVKSAHIINGMKDESLLRTLLTEPSPGTSIRQ
jgi:acetylglutamate kinase